MYEMSQTQQNDTFIVKDPSQSDGFKRIYINQLSFQIRLEEGPGNIRTLPNNQMLYVKVMVKDHQQPAQLKIQLTCDNDLYFNFQCIIDESKFSSMKTKQNICIQFRQFINVIIKNLQKAEKQPHIYFLVFTIFSDFEGKFNIIQKTQFKNYQILSFDFRKATDQFIRDNITFRYNMMKRNIADTTIKLQEIDQTVKSKNPSLLLQIRKKMPPLGFNKK